MVHQLIQKLGLRPHPEGGWYREIYRSATTVGFNNSQRSALTSIYFLLEARQVSRWHVVDADEVWHFYEGEALELHVMSPDFSSLQKIVLGETSQSGQPVHVVPAGWWQA